MIEQWQKQGIISSEQAQKMSEDLRSTEKAARSNNFIVIISTIGAILIGLGAILFIASNWDELSDLTKILILAIATFGSHGLGYYLTYYKKNLPQVGAALLLLSILLFGASIFLIAQIYHIKANSDNLILIWLIGAVPMVYAYRSGAYAVLAATIFYAWVAFHFFASTGLDVSFVSLPIIFFSASAMIFGLGGLHYLMSGYDLVARAYRTLSVKVAMLSLFLLTFEAFSGFESHDYGDSLFGTQLYAIYVMAGIGLLAMLLQLMRKKGGKALEWFENGSGLFLSLLVLTYISLPGASDLYLYVFNLVFAILVIILIYVGIQREDMAIVNNGIFWTAAFIIAKYFDFFWDMLPRSIFFMAGGLILVGGSVFLERKRRELKKGFVK